MTGSLKLHPLDILLRLSPLAAFQSIVLAWLQGELTLVLRQYNDSYMSREIMTLLLLNGSLALLQNVSSFHTNKMAGALTVSVCGNVKQCATILLGIITFRTQMGILNGMGIAIVSGSSAWYSWIQLQQKKRATARELPP